MRRYAVARAGESGLTASYASGEPAGENITPNDEKYQMLSASRMCRSGRKTASLLLPEEVKTKGSVPARDYEPLQERVQT